MKQAYLSLLKKLEETLDGLVEPSSFDLSLSSHENEETSRSARGRGEAELSKRRTKESSQSRPSK